MRYRHPEANVDLIKAGKVTLDEDGEVWCQCEPPQPAVELTVKKEGPNTGRIFFKCDGDHCDFFAWEDSIEKTRKRYKLGPDYERPLEPEEIRGRANGGGGQRLGEDPAGPVPHTPLQRKAKDKKQQRITDSDDEDEKPYPGWDASDSEVELTPVPTTKHKKRGAELATPEPTPQRKKAKAIPARGLLDDEHNPFQVAPAAEVVAAANHTLGAEDPFLALQTDVDKAQSLTQELKGQLTRATNRMQYLEARLEQAEKEKFEAQEQNRVRGLRIQTLEETVGDLNRILGAK